MYAQMLIIILIKTTSNNCYVPVEPTLLDEDQLVWQTEAVVLTTYQKELAVFLTGGLQANHMGRKKTTPMNTAKLREQTHSKNMVSRTCHSNKYKNS